MDQGTRDKDQGDSSRGQELAKITTRVTTEWTILVRHQPRIFRRPGLQAAQVCRAIVSLRAAHTLGPGRHATPLTFTPPGRDSAPDPSKPAGCRGRPTPGVRRWKRERSGRCKPSPARLG